MQRSRLYIKHSHFIKVPNAVESQNILRNMKLMEYIPSLS